ncbi:stage II sporulation protein D [Caproiciproducens sp. MSJ-32]|uniref:stage II sporulation protein D n=1 Tax=Caproiciproducens sp. MSJ-32 TaxID=2841527 RepID=UPI001C0F9984|nr:stage II sporulation protein D [Caproiciproducens sp. MSJ-32]MBU5454351.1 stage II sporulation protein D [Caproiciproducens sp. MSJ-32]
MKKKFININKNLSSLIVFSTLVLILMIIIPIIIIKPAVIAANAQNIEEEQEANSQESNLISIDGNEIVKVHITESNEIKEVALEEYVKSVVSGEMPVSFNMEALKAQAVAARTFAVAKMLNPCPNANGGNVCDTTHCQVYIAQEKRIEKWGEAGEEYWNKISTAVEETRGEVLTYNNELVKYPQFFSTSSGMTENAIDVFSGDIPYLVSKESKGEEIAPKYRTEFSFNVDEFVSKINYKYPDAGLEAANINRDIEILSRSEAGGVKEIRVGKKVIKGLDFRLTLGLSSANFEFILTGNEILFKCKGYGHGVGMSQWGANVMAGEGKSYDEILKHYYTGVDIKDLKFN